MREKLDKFQILLKKTVKETHMIQAVDAKVAEVELSQMQAFAQQQKQITKMQQDLYLVEAAVKSKLENF
jgi:hypothetical protein